MRIWRSLFAERPATGSIAPGFKIVLQARYNECEKQDIRSIFDDNQISKGISSPTGCAQAWSVRRRTAKILFSRENFEEPDPVQKKLRKKLQ